MMRRYTALVSTILVSLSWSALTPNAQAVELKLFAGPQSVMPGETVHVTVQSYAQEIDVELSYKSHVGLKTLKGATEQGLVSFQIPAQKTVGRMQFVAKAGGDVSNTALVFIHADLPENFDLEIKEGTQAGTLDISSAHITDSFGNLISDLTLASLDWIDEKGLIATQNVQLTQGHIILSADCPREFEGALTLHAAVNTASVRSSDLSSLCREKSNIDAR